MDTLDHGGQDATTAATAAPTGNVVVYGDIRNVELIITEAWVCLDKDDDPVDADYREVLAILHGYDGAKSCARTVDVSQHFTRAEVYQMIYGEYDRGNTDNMTIEYLEAAL